MAKKQITPVQHAIRSIPLSARPAVLRWLVESADLADRTAARLRDASDIDTYYAIKGTVGYWRSVARACRLLEYRLRSAAAHKAIVEDGTSGN